MKAQHLIAEFQQCMQAEFQQCMQGLFGWVDSIWADESEVINSASDKNLKKLEDKYLKHGEAQATPLCWLWLRKYEIDTHRLTVSFAAYAQNKSKNEDEHAFLFAFISARG